MSLSEIRVSFDLKLLQLWALLSVISGEGSMVFRQQSEELQDHYLILCADLVQDCAELSNFLDQSREGTNSAGAGREVC